MAQSSALVDTLKQALKSHRITYREVARRLDISEANVKRLFATRRFTLARLEDICRLMEMDLSDLVRLYETSRQKVDQLSIEQETELVSDTRLLIVAVSVRNHLTFEEIVASYALSEAECIRALARLDRLKLIDLLPNNRIKLRIDENFHWIPNGPIEQYFERRIQADFMGANFSGEGEQRLFQFGLLSEHSAQVIDNKLRALAREFGELMRHDVNLPLAQRRNYGCMLALRPWRVSAFEAMRKE
ncbi:MAG TPA: transcriptional regulator [Porticoccaceae bacterium]|nr:transcriptional regulator [Porticoccaceae bacterium]